MKINFKSFTYSILIALFVNVSTFGQINLEEMDIQTLQQGYKTGKFTVSQVVEAYIKRIEEIDQSGPELNSVIMVNPDALTRAKELDILLKKNKKMGGMFGVPVLLKDNLDTHDKMPTTAGSRALMNSFPLKDSKVAEQLRDANAIILGKTNLSEWANFRGQKSSSGWSGLGGQTKNPYVTDCNPCGSSAGSGVAVSANLSMVAIGTETNGSIVCPSSANGIVGIKPTVGLVSRSGVIPISSTQDTPGPMAKSVADAAICLNAITGYDAADIKTVEAKGFIQKDYTKFLDKNGLKNKRIGLYMPPMGKLPEVDKLVYKAIEDLKSQGAEVVQISEIGESKVGEYSFEIMLYEYKAGLNDYFKSLGPNAPIKNLEELIAFNKSDSIELKYFNQRYLEMALEKEDLDSPKYKEVLANLLRGSRENGLDKVMAENKLDAIIAPTGGPAWKTNWETGDTFHIGSSSPAARAGYPNITVPMGFVGELPVGLSFFGKAFSEPTLISIAYAYEQATKHRKVPKFLK
ncbi:amidase [Lacihabitans lacunae]|uniref:Amidase n=1 Tax=Lacihabitans lacunae TaxID=1028214 RepID=A0ABV7Z347_9BACT